MWYRHVQWNDWLWAIEHSSKLIVSCSSPARPNNAHDRNLWCTKRGWQYCYSSIAGYNISDVSCLCEVNRTACHLVLTYCVVSVRHAYVRTYMADLRGCRFTLLSHLQSPCSKCINLYEVLCTSCQMTSAVDVHSYEWPDSLPLLHNCGISGREDTIAQ